MATKHLLFSPLLVQVKLHSSKTILGFGDNYSNPKESWRLVAGEDRYRSNFQDTTIRSNTDSPSIISNVNKAALITMSYSGGGVNDVSNQLIYENGVLKTNTGSSGSYSGAALIADTPELNVGSGFGGVNSWEGDIAEVVIYNRLLSDHEREEVEAYLAQKWLDEPYKKEAAKKFMKLIIVLLMVNTRLILMDITDLCHL